MQVDVIKQGLDLQIDASNGKAGLELQQPDAVAGSLGAVEREADNAYHAERSTGLAKKG